MLNELKYAFFLIPLFFMFCLYMITMNFAGMGLNIIVSLLTASTVSVISSTNVLDTGLKGYSIKLIFIMSFGLGFWGLSLFGLTNTITQSSNPYAEPTNAFLFGALNLWINRGKIQQPIPVNNTGNLIFDFNALSVSDFGLPFNLWAGLMICLSFIYGLGLYLIASDSA